MSRSTKPDVRNPLVHMQATLAIQAMPVEARTALKLLLKEVSKDARSRANKTWNTHKAPMAAYWKAVAVYANHAQRVISTKEHPSP